MLLPERFRVTRATEYAFALLIITSAASGTARTTECEDLAEANFGAARVTAATRIAAGSFAPPPIDFGPGAPGSEPSDRGTEPSEQGPGIGPSPYARLGEFCRVELTSTPARQSEIGIEVWLPTPGWNGMLLGIGNGAWGGSISHISLAEAIESGYAAVATDTGHAGMGAEFLTEHRNKLRDFAWRAVHEMTVAAKAVVESYYEREQDHAYFSGCSTGGRQALMAAQRYPHDYDGIIAGAPAHHPSHLQGMQLWTTSMANRSVDAILSPEDFRLINGAAMAACDDLDGVSDGVIEDPRQCYFDPGVLACGAEAGSDCLTDTQVETARMIYAGPTDSAGNSIYPGLAPGSEAGWRSMFSGEESGWTTLAGAEPLALALETYDLLVYPNRDLDWRSFDAESDIRRAERRIGSIMDATDPDLSEFVDNGGKLILYHGWSDPGVPPAGTIAYHRALQTTLGSALTDDSVRLFMVPGMGHCRGGTGTDNFDALAALDQWVSNGEAPERIEAQRRVRGDVTRTRPLCAYPQSAVWDQVGNSDASGSFSCR